MADYKILFINLGYARGISGRLVEHVRHWHRHFYCSPRTQKSSLDKLNKLIENEAPDLCCFVEIDQGLFSGGSFNQLNMIVNQNYRFSDIENKYGKKSLLRSFVLTAGKSNAFIAKKKHDFEKIFFNRGLKRLVYKISIDEGITVFFSHFSLNKNVRAQQLQQAYEMMRQAKGEVIFLGDFNILSGLHEIDPLINDGQFVLLNRADIPTFNFHNKQTVLDLCICSKALSKNVDLKIIPQSYTDHAALILAINTKT